VNVVIVVLGAVGLVAAAYFLVDLMRDAVRRRQWLDIVVALAFVVATVWLLFTYGGRLMQ
jgi:hypothetical protein